MVNSDLLNFKLKRLEDDLRVIFDQWPKLHLGLDALTKQSKNLERCLLNMHFYPFFVLKSDNLATI